LNWYGDRAGDAATSAMFTGAFNVDPKILGPMSKHGPAMRFILLERPPTAEITQAQANNPSDPMFSYGAILGRAQFTQEHTDDAHSLREENARLRGLLVQLPDIICKNVLHAR
jgi:hypothetical protein